ncbi:6-phosphogluconolactonase [Methylobacterium sp. Leaf361]|nr:6-phosphogluconolactonase [Methylobacterium sp. Leaf361]
MRYKHMLSAGLAIAPLVVTPAAAKTMVYVSNSVDGTIDVFSMDPVSGDLHPQDKTTVAKIVMPMAVSPDKHHLYAVVRSEPTRVVTYAIDDRTGALTKEAEAPLPGSMPYVSTDRAGHFLFTASYAGNRVAVSPIDRDGRVTREAIQVVPTGNNAHAIQADRTNRFVFASNLGSDQIAQFRFDAATGQLSPNAPPVVKTIPGEGPRHFIFSPDDRFVYVLHELAGTVARFALDQTRGTLTLLDTVESVPPESNLERGVVQGPITAARLAARAEAPPTEAKRRMSAADIQITPDGRFIYTTERTSSKLALFEVDTPAGKLQYIENISTATQPRGIRIDPRGTFLVASGEKSNHVLVYRINRENGHLSEVGRYPGGEGANWVEIVDLP